MKKTNYYEICKQKLKYFNYSERTINSYLFYIKQFLDTIKKSPTRLTSEDFQSYLDQYSFSSISHQNQVINSIRFLYKFGLNKKYSKVSFKRPKSEKKITKSYRRGVYKKSIIQDSKYKASSNFNVNLFSWA